MREERTSGGKEFMIALGIAAVLYLICGMGMSLFGDYAFIGGIISILVFCVFGFFILTRYTSKFTYTLKGGRLRINRMIGKRNKEVEFSVSDIADTAYGVKPESFPKKPYMMRVSLKSNKKSMFISYKDRDGKIQGVVIEPSDKLRKRIDRERTQAEND